MADATTSPASRKPRIRMQRIAQCEVWHCEAVAETGYEIRGTAYAPSDAYNNYLFALQLARLKGYVING